MAKDRDVKTFLLVLQFTLEDRNEVSVDEGDGEGAGDSGKITPATHGLVRLDIHSLTRFTANLLTQLTDSVTVYVTHVSLTRAVCSPVCMKEHHDMQKSFIEFRNKVRVRNASVESVTVTCFCCPGAVCCVRGRVMRKFV